MSAESFDPYHRWLGIPPKDQPPDHYRLLGIERFESNPDVISDAADRQMVHLRNYQLGKSAALSQKILNEVSAARLCLLDPQKKADYDAQLRRNAAVQAHAAPAVPAPAAAPVPVPPSPAATPVPGVPVPQVRPDSVTQRAAKRKRSSALPVVVVGIAGLLLAGGLVWYLNDIQQPWLGVPLIARDGRGDATMPGPFGTGDHPEPHPRGAAESRDRDSSSGESAESRPARDRPKDGTLDRRIPAASDPPPLRDPRSLADLMKESGPPADRSGRQTPTEPSDALNAQYYVWQWQLERGSAVRLKFYPDGTVSNFHESTGNPDFTWALSGDTLVLRWPQGRVDTMTVSPDGRSCFGVNQAGRRVFGQLFSVGPPRS